MKKNEISKKQKIIKFFFNLLKKNRLLKKYSASVRGSATSLRRTVTHPPTYLIVAWDATHYHVTVSSNKLRHTMHKSDKKQKLFKRRSTTVWVFESQNFLLAVILVFNGQQNKFIGLGDSHMTVTRRRHGKMTWHATVTSTMTKNRYGDLT